MTNEWLFVFAAHGLLAVLALLVGIAAMLAPPLVLVVILLPLLTGPRVRMDGADRSPA